MTNEEKKQYMEEKRAKTKLKLLKAKENLEKGYLINLKLNRLENCFYKWWSIRYKKFNITVLNYEGFKRRKKYLYNLIFKKFEVKTLEDLEKLLKENKLKGYRLYTKNLIEDFTKYCISESKRIELMIGATLLYNFACASAYYIVKRIHENKYYNENTNSGDLY